MAPAVRAAADRRWRDLLIFERGVRERATQLRDGPPSDEELAPYRAAADAVALEFFVSAVARELASISQAVGA
jgi:hypothetical protein